LKWSQALRFSHKDISRDYGQEIPANTRRTKSCPLSGSHGTIAVIFKPARALCGSDTSRLGHHERRVDEAYLIFFIEARLCPEAIGNVRQHVTQNPCCTRSERHRYILGLRQRV
jgi:hypothetical protein